MWVKQCHTTHLEMVYTSFKNGDLGDGLLAAATAIGRH
jgi:hypothetical protein